MIPGQHSVPFGDQEETAMVKLAGGLVTFFKFLIDTKKNRSGYRSKAAVDSEGKAVRTGARIPRFIDDGF